MAQPAPDELRRMIDEALAEIEELEADVIALFEDLGGPDLAAQVLRYYEAMESEPRTEALRREASRGSSSEPPAPR